MRRISLIPGARIHQPRSVPSLIHSSCPLRIRPAGSSPLSARSPLLVSSCRQFHAHTQLAGFAQDILSGFIGDDDGNNAVRAAAKDAGARRVRYREELERLDWMHPSLKSILTEGHPDRVFHALQHPERGPDFISRASPSLFAETLALIPPSHFIKPYTANYFLFDQHRSKTIPNGLRGEKVEPNNDETVMGLYRVYSNLQLRFDDFTSKITGLLNIRQQSGHPPTLDTYAYLLDLARTMSDGDMADAIYPEMKKAKIQLDERCYNCYMEAKVWAGAYDFYEHHKRGTTKRMLAIRSLLKRPPGFTAYRTGPEGLRMHMIQILDEMVSNGYQGSEPTFSHIITAMGREGDLEGLKSILRSVWNIDVDLMQEVDEEELETPTYYDRGSPLRPTSHLLFAIAHAYSTNREPLMGLKIVDFISRQYDLSITRDVWIELLTGTFLRCIPRRPQYDEPDIVASTLPMTAFEDLWAVMIDQPHNIKPDEMMHLTRTRVFRHNLKRDQTFDSLARTEEHLNKRRIEAYNTLEKFLETSEDVFHEANVKQDDYILPAPWFDLRNELIQAQVTVEAALHVLIFNTSRALTEEHFPGSRATLTWEREVLPDAIRNMERYLPNILAFRTSGGTAVFDKLYSMRHNAIEESFGWIHSYLGLVRLGFDDFDHARLKRNLPHLSEAREALRPHCWQCGEYGHVATTCPGGWVSKGTIVRQVAGHKRTREILRSRFESRKPRPDLQLAR